MNHQPQESRRKAAQKFMNSLAELETVLQSENAWEEPDEAVAPRAQSAKKGASVAPSVHRTDLSQLMEEALQDIEQFMAEPPTDET